MALLLAGLFVSSSPRFAADAVKVAPVSSTLVDTGSAGVTRPSTVPSRSATLEPSAVPAISQAGTVPTVVVPSAHPAPTRPPAPTPAPVAAAPPTVHLTVTPLSGLAPLTVTANAAGSASVNGIASYVFDFGDGTGPASGAIASHTYCRVGHYQLSLTVTDTVGLHSTAYWPVDVTPQDPPAPSC